MNESTIFNGTLDINSTKIIDSDKNFTAADEEDVAELVIMAVTSIVLGLMILITVIGMLICIMNIFNMLHLIGHSVDSKDICCDSKDIERSKSPC